MSKEFAMLKAARRLENYLSRERYNLNKMRENNRVSDSLMESKASNYNELVVALNDLFGEMTESAGLLLFDLYFLNDEDEAPISVELPSYQPAPEPVSPHTQEQAVAEAQALVESAVANSASAPAPAPQAPAVPETTVPDMADIRDADTPGEPVWKLAGYESEQAWVADKEVETTEIVDDLSVSVNVGLAQHRADQVLNEYNQTREQDIDTYMPEDDKPISVLPSDDASDDDDDDSDRPTSDVTYLNHTGDGVRVDNDPTQIAGVETAVEREGADGNKGTDIDVGAYSYRSNSSVVANLIDSDLQSLHIQRESVPADESGESEDETDADSEI